MTGNQFDKLLAVLERIATQLERIADAKESEGPGYCEHIWSREKDGGVQCSSCGERQ